MDVERLARKADAPTQHQKHTRRERAGQPLLAQRRRVPHLADSTDGLAGQTLTLKPLGSATTATKEWITTGVKCRTMPERTASNPQLSTHHGIASNAYRAAYVNSSR